MPGAFILSVIAGFTLIGAAATTGSVALVVSAVLLGPLFGYGVALIGGSSGSKRTLLENRPLASQGERLGPHALRIAVEGHRAARAVLHEIHESSPFIRGLFEPAVESVKLLQEKQTALAVRLDQLVRHSRNDEAARILGEGQEVARRMRATHDPAAREQYARAYRAIEETLTSLADLERDARRIEAQLEAIHASFGAARAKVVHAKSYEARGAALSEVASDEVSGPLQALANEVDASSGAVDDVFVHPRDQPEPRAERRAGPKRLGEPS